uniref:hypothetical protein n=1 Tax=Mycobacterium hubeiense TaxID=1867256 RepID=UPI001E5FFA04
RGRVPQPRLAERAIATAIAGGDDLALNAALGAFISGPQYVIDPLGFAADDVLPPPIGGDPSEDPTDMYGSEISKFRADVMLAARDDVREAVRDTLGIGPETQPDGNEVTGIYLAARLAGGLAESGFRAASGAAMAPLGLLAIADALANQDNEALYVAIRQYIDAPLWAADPTIFAADDVLPEPWGGDPDNDPTSQGESAVTAFRNDVLWNGTRTVRTAVADVLGVDPDLDQGDLTSSAQSNASARLASGAGEAETNEAAAGATRSERRGGPVSRIVNSLKTDPKASSGKHRTPSTGLSGLFKPRKKAQEDAADHSAATDADSKGAATD